MNFFLLLIFMLKVLSSKGGLDQPYDFLKLGIGDRHCNSYSNSNYFCHREEDNTITVIVDCNQNTSLEVGNKTNVGLWSPDFPQDMKTLIVQNCKELNIYTNLLIPNSDGSSKHLYKQKKTPGSNFQLLHVRNVTNLYVKNKMLGSPSEYFYDTDDMDKYYRKDLRACLPAKVIFESVGELKFVEFQYFPIIEPCSKYVFNSLKLINVSVNYLSSIFGTKLFTLNEFVMDNVMIKNTEDYAINIDNKTAFVTVKNSVFHTTNDTLIDCNAYEVVLSNNSFKHLQGKKTFILNADKIVLEGNTIPTGDNTFDLSATHIKIAGNVFQHLKKNFFSITPASAIHKSTCYNFSGNVISYIEPMAFSYDHDNPWFDQIVIANNEINCTCKSMEWFHFMAGQNLNFHTKISKIKWFQPKNNNQCSNIPNCFLNGVLNNYHDLCEKDFNCSESLVSTTNEISYTELNQQENFLNYNNEIYDNILKILQILIENKNCILALTFLSFVIVFLVLIIKIWEFKMAKMFPRRKKFAVETEMNAPSVTELHSVPN